MRKPRTPPVPAGSSYRWRTGFGAQGVPAAEAAGVIRRCHGDPRAVVQAARDPNNPLHPLFNWNDEDAAEQHRIAQARLMIRSLIVTYKEREVHAFHLAIQPAANVPDKRVYVSVEQVAADTLAWRTAVYNWASKVGLARRALSSLTVAAPAGSDLEPILLRMESIERDLLAL